MQLSRVPVPRTMVLRSPDRTATGECTPTTTGDHILPVERAAELNESDIQLHIDDRFVCIRPVVAREVLNGCDRLISCIALWHVADLSMMQLVVA